MVLRIYQLTEDNEHEFLFVPYNELNGHIDMSRYRIVYENIDFDTCNMPVLDVLEHIYTMLNIGKKPETYNGHSLSVSDIVELDGNRYYVDDYGFETL